MTETRTRYYALNPLESAALPDCVLAVLKDCTGSERAVAATSIAELIGFQDGNGCKTRAVIRELIAQGQPIAAHNGGFYFVTSEEEARTYLANLRGRALAIFKRYKQFSLNSQRLWNIPYEQLELEGL